jgi:hypothetical protein
VHDREFDIVQNYTSALHESGESVVCFYPITQHHQDLERREFYKKMLYRILANYPNRRNLWIIFKIIGIKDNDL